MPKFDEEQVKHLELLATALDKGQSYNAFFVAAGYATFFALWKNTEGCATPASHMVAGALLAVSVVCYVIWMALGLIALNVAMRSLVEQVGTEFRRQAQPDQPSPKEAIEYLRKAIADKDSGMTPSQRVKWRVHLLVLDAGKIVPRMLIAILLPALVGIAIVFSTYIHGAWIGYHGQPLQCAVSANQ